ncbi:MAG: hypothetical protein IPG43_20400 [Proteobacteria bacterium]|nr:hypothetical protein [Pseudomonadota bacterium]
MQLHPRDTGGTFLEIDQQLDDDANWVPAGDDWRAHVRTSRIGAIAAAEIQADAPLALARRWAAITQAPLVTADGVPHLRLDNADVRFVRCADGRPEGLAGLDLATTDKGAITAALKRLGIAHQDSTFVLDGMRWRLV